jgi:23S rRNA G2445 N2-methylase RlmL
VRLHHGACGEWQPASAPTLVATNPPWGVRLRGEGGGDGDGGGRLRLQARGDRGAGRGRGGFEGPEEGGGGEEVDGAVAGSWRELASFLKAECGGADAWVLSGSPGLTSELGMRSFKRRAVTVGGVKAAWLGYEVHGGRDGGAAAAAAGEGG